MASQPPSELFLEQVKEALENLYDFPFLNRHVLAETTPVRQGNEPAGHRLRRELVTAIESLKPDQPTGARINSTRLYQLLQLHYVGGMTIQEVANDLGISVRQAYRDLRQGTVSVGEILWFQRLQTQEVPPTAKPPFTELIPISLTVIHVQTLLEAAVKAVQRLSEQNQVQLDVHYADEMLTISADASLTQQIFIHLLSQTIQQANPDVLRIELKAFHDRAVLELSCVPRHNTPLVIPTMPIIQEFIQRLHFIVQVKPDAHGRQWLQLEMPLHQATILIIDDHQGLLDLVQRYLIDQTYQVLTATNGIDGLKLAEELQPNGIILDLMMPRMDGWELLQRLRTTPATAHIPVIICSVIQDPELAYSLGAAHFIDKPITKDSILLALSKIGL